MSLNFNLNIKKSIVFLKVATTGPNPVRKNDSPGLDRIVEISITKIGADRTVKTGTKLVNPEMEITEESTKMHGITNQAVSSMPKFKDIASNLYSFIGDSDIAGFGIYNFDLQFLIEEFNRAGIEFSTIGRKVIDLSDIYKCMEKRDFSAASLFYTGNELSSQEIIGSEKHNNIAINILNGIVTRYAGDERFKTPTVDSLSDPFKENKLYLDISGHIILNSDGRPVFSDGKYKNHIISEILISDLVYYDWYVNVSDMPSDTKILVKKIVEKAKSSQKI